jgi:hypothetical protein
MRDVGLRESVGGYVTFKPPHTLAEPADDVTLLADVVDRTAHHWDGCEDRGQCSPRSPGLWTRRVGRGTIVYCGVDYFRTYLRHPVPRLTGLLRAILTGLRPPAVTAHAPLCVTMNVRAQPDGRWAVHLHNAPGSAYAYPNPPGGNMLHAPGEVVPVHDVVIEVASGVVTEARSGITGEAFEVEHGRLARVPRIELQDVVLLTQETRSCDHAF